MALIYLAECAVYLGGASATSLTVGTGVKTFTIGADDPRPIKNMTLRIERAAASGTYMEGVVTAISGNSVSVNVAATGGAGTHTDWVVGDGVLRFTSGRAFNTKASETPASVHYFPRMQQPAAIERNIFERTETFGRSSFSQSEMKLVNSDGSLDAILRYGFDDRELTLRLGEEGGDYPSDYPAILISRMEQPVFSDTSLSIKIVDKAEMLLRPIQATKYLGNNTPPNGAEGLEGDIKGKPKPLGYGEPANVSSVPVNSSLLTYQINDGTVVSFPAVYDSGYVLTAGTNRANLAALEAATPPAAGYDTCLSLGLFRLGSAPAGQITSDVVAGATSADRTVAAIVEDIIRGPGGLASGEVSSSDLTALDSDNNSVVGLWIDAERQVAEVVDELCATVGAGWWFDNAGVFRIRRIEEPSGTPVTTFRRFGQGVAAESGDGDILKLDVLPSDLPVWRFILGYGKNYTVQTSDLVGSVTTARRAFLKEEYRYTSPADDADVLLKYPKGRQIDREDAKTLLTDAGDAEDERDRRAALYADGRLLLRVAVRLTADLASVLDLGLVVQVVFPRFELDDGRLFLVLGLKYDARLSRIEAILWG